LRRSYLAEWYFLTKLSPQVSPFLVPFFGVNNSLCLISGQAHLIS
jgi:hypothetical protein